MAKTTERKPKSDRDCQFNAHCNGNCGQLRIAMVTMIQKRGLRDFDWLLAFLAIGIVAFGTIQIRYAQPTEGYWVKQLIGLGIAIIAMLAVAFNDYRKLLNIAPAFYIFGLLLLVIVLIPGIGLKINGQRAWIKVPGIGQFQPSEFVKVTTAMMLARYFGRHRSGSLTLAGDCGRRLDPGPSYRLDPFGTRRRLGV